MEEIETLVLKEFAEVFRFSLRQESSKMLGPYR